MRIARHRCETYRGRKHIVGETLRFRSENPDGCRVRRPVRFRTRIPGPAGRNRQPDETDIRHRERLRDKHRSCPTLFPGGASATAERRNDRLLSPARTPNETHTTRHRDAATGNILRAETIRDRTHAVLVGNGKPDIAFAILPLRKTEQRRPVFPHVSKESTHTQKKKNPDSADTFRSTGEMQSAVLSRNGGNP